MIRRSQAITFSVGVTVGHALGALAWMPSILPAVQWACSILILFIAVVMIWVMLREERP